MEGKSRRAYSDRRIDEDQKPQPPGFGIDTLTAGPTTTSDKCEALPPAQEKDLDPDFQYLGYWKHMWADILPIADFRTLVENSTFETRGNVGNLPSICSPTGMFALPDL